MNKYIKFSNNWNNKLNSKAFTTIRIFNNSEYYKEGEIYDIKYQEKTIFQAKIIETKKIHASKLPSFITYLDAGFNRKEFMQIMEKIYKNKNININDTTFIIILLLNIRKK
jgi:hypothetical protein